MAEGVEEVLEETEGVAPTAKHDVARAETSLKVSAKAPLVTPNLVPVADPTTEVPLYNT